ncbi:hypothetical protein BDA99DRAFT_592128 [Phascolomyces articulosus]|uniref:Uncharacterized protein n=1 Tax=Phascolomyces articulosus TaxID=60185 RepID=A0AAD5P890_9FUNG|nr:hypothetical protein BDA99DRAFT_592128 [Phascolomyces articulosus]
MIFQHCTSMDATLRRHPYRTTNAVESFHRDLYRDMVHRLPLSLALPQLLNYIQSDVRILANYEEHAVPPAYNRAPRPKKKRSSIKRNTEEIMQRIMGTDLKKVDQEKRMDEKKNNKMSENTPDTMKKKKSDRKNKKRKQLYDTEELWPSSKKPMGIVVFVLLLLQLYGDQDQYQKIKQTMLNHLFANYEFYLDILAKVFDERPSWKSILYLPFTIPSDTNREPQPINIFLHSNYFSVVDLIPSRARHHMVWLAVKPYHEAEWGILDLNVKYNAIWKYINRKRLTQEENNSWK